MTFTWLLINNCCLLSYKLKNECVHLWMFNTSKDDQEYTRGCFVHWTEIMMNAGGRGDIMMRVGDIMLRVGGYYGFQYSVGFHSNSIVLSIIYLLSSIVLSIIYLPHFHHCIPCVFMIPCWCTEYLPEY